MLCILFLNREKLLFCMGVFVKWCSLLDWLDVGSLFSCVFLLGLVIGLGCCCGGCGGG